MMEISKEVGQLDSGGGNGGGEQWLGCARRRQTPLKLHMVEMRARKGL